MIDFHNHVLPNVDDGPKAMKESIEMLICASKQGITDIVQTVHFQHPKMDGKNVEYDYLKNEVQKLQIEASKENINIKIHLSAEVFYLPNLVQISENPLVTVGEGKYMLVEFSSNIFPAGYENEFYKLQLKGICPIIAHPERYRFIQNDIDILKDWLCKGYIIQVDAGSILGYLGKPARDKSLEMINKGFVHLIGSDAHNNRNRNFCIGEAYKYLKSINLNKYVDILIKNSSNILCGQEITIYDKKENKSIYNKFNFFKLLDKFRQRVS